MKAMVLSKIAPIETAPLAPAEVEPPVPRYREIRIKILACAICRTDLHVIEGDLPQEKLPIIPGHQVVGDVDALGKGCRLFKRGQRVGVAWLHRSCGHCQYCKRDRENLCESPQFTGYHVNGGYAEYMVAPEAFAYRVPKGYDASLAAPLLCSGIIGFRALARSNLPKGGKLGLFGFGSSAHVVLQLAEARGAKVYVVSRGKAHLELARQMGAEWVGEKTTDLPTRLDSAILFAPAGHLVPDILSVLDKGGTLATAGIHMTDIPALNYQRHLFYEKNLCSVTASTRRDGSALLKEAARVGVQPHITTYALSDANRALQDLKSDLISGSGVLRVS